MNTTVDLISRDALTFTITAEALALKESALDQSALVGKVTNADEQAVAVNAQAELRRCIKAIEDAHRIVKRPILDAGIAVDALKKNFAEELKAEELRVARLVGDFQQLELARVRAAEQAARKELEEKERQRQAELAQAKSHEEAEAVQARFNQEAQAAPPPVAPARVEGQIVREEWEFEVTDIWTLARAHPTCVKIEARRSEIKALLDAGVKLAGVRAWKETKSSVRTNARPTAIAA